jgi:TetR/AcrR family transcriptional regulator, transcriptional repressor for nem operon
MTVAGTRTRLLDCAESAVRARGFDGFSYADLSAGVGIRKASVHHYFPTKADLALALIERYSADFFARLDAIVQSQAAAAGQLRAYIAACREALDGGTKLCLCVAFATSRDGLSQPVLEQLDTFHVTVARWLEAVFTRGQVDGTVSSVGNPGDEANSCLAMMEGAQLISRAAKDVMRFDAAVQTLLARLA